MSTFATLAAGAVFGIRHALESDHIAAVMTLITDEQETDRSGAIGAWWGIGHSLPILVLGLSFVALGIRVPESITQWFEILVGALVTLLGVRMLWRAIRDVDVGKYEHDHDDGHEHEHGHGNGHDRAHSHLRIGSVSLGDDHVHFRGDSFLVGVVHGLAGSGALVIALVSTAPTAPTALAFLVSFSLLSILTMAGVSAVWGRTLDTDAARYLKATAGLVGIAVGALLVAEQLPSML